MTIKLKAGMRLVIASHNPGKVREINALLAPYGIDTVPAGELDLPEPEETGKTFIANAELKAKAAVDGTGRPALADDSGIAIHGLDGQPGIYSARWAGPEKDFAAAMAQAERELAAASQETGVDNRRAAFVCALCLAYPDGRERAFEGRIEGRLTWPPRGDRGFGYDPMFVPDGHDRTFGEMGPAEKRDLSHRARALRLLGTACFEGSAER